VRDSLSVLERVLAFCGHEVQDDDVLRLLGAVHATVLAGTLRSLADRDAGGMLRVLDELVDEGRDLLHFWSELIAALRDLLFLSAVPDRADLLSRPPEEATLLQEATGDLSREDLTRAFQILADLEPALKNSSQPRFMFEATLIRLASLGAVRPIEEVLRSLGPDAGDLPARPPAKKKSPTDGPPARFDGPPADRARVADPPTPAPPATAAAATPSAARTAEGGPATARSGLRGDLQARIQSARPMLGAILEQARTVELRDSQLLVLFRDKDNALAQPLLRDDGLDLLRKHAGELAGRTVKVSIAIGDAPGPTAAKAAAPASPAAPPGARITKAGLIERAKQDPGVKKLLREFGAQVVEIRPLASGAEEEHVEDA
jgi:DNA polymerase-3 subunit gamma/tau